MSDLQSETQMGHEEVLGARHNQPNVQVIEKNSNTLKTKKSHNRGQQSGENPRRDPKPERQNLVVKGPNLKRKAEKRIRNLKKSR